MKFGNVERQKELVVVNGKKKPKGSSKNKRKSTGARKRRSTAKRAAPRRRSARRRNPGTDVKGHVGAALAGGAAALLMQPAVHRLTGSISNRMLRTAARTLGTAGVGVGLALVASKVGGQSVGKGIAGGAGAVATLHGMSEVANGNGSPKPMLQKLGYAQLGAPENIFESGGQVFQMLPDGRAQLLFGASAEPIVLKLKDGGTEDATSLGSLGNGEQLVMLKTGELVALPSGELSGDDDDGLSGVEGMEGIERAENLSGDDDDGLSGVEGIERAENLSGDDDDTLSGLEGDDNGVGYDG
jgi:hypothetical protein